MRKRILGVAIGVILAGLGGVTAAADTSPNGPGQPGAPNTTCQTFTVTPGNAVSAPGSVFNPAGTSGGVYAGNPGTPSLANGSATAVSQYDIACFQQTAH
jgi:hypothetical protein